jgi:membrane peptidoglycan carboxypeptidase
VRNRPRRRRLLIAILTVITIVGTSLMAGAIYVASINLPDVDELAESTVVYYSDGRTVMARLGQANRTVLASERMVEPVKLAIVAAEEPEFWTSSAGTINRALVRSRYGVEGTNPAARLRVAVLAWRLNEALSKEEILETYLNTMPFGREALGIEQAAASYFGKSADNQAPADRRISTAEAIVLASMVGESGTTPSPTRWAEVRESMVRLEYLTREEADALVYPEPAPFDAEAGASQLDRPTGLIINHVLAELVAGSFRGRSWDQIKNGGYKIITTVDATAQALLERTADETVSGSAMFGQPSNLQAAAVAVEPLTGRVLAYYGGHNGAGADFAGFFIDSAGDATGFGAHPPGDTFYVYTLAAALRGGISLKSAWQAASPMNFPGRTGANAIRNSAICPTGAVCTLAEATRVSLSTVFYAVGATVSTLKVVETAHAAGIDFMWADPDDAKKRTRLDLGAQPLTDVVPARLDDGAALGEFPVTVIDQANAMATFAARGRPADAHFVTKVFKGNETVFAEKPPAAETPAILGAAQESDLTFALSRTAAGRLAGRDSASKTGSWPAGPRAPQHAWMVGYTRNLGLAVWVGNKGNEQGLKDKAGRTVFGSGLPATIYRSFMTTAHTQLKLKTTKFAAPAFAGDDSRGNAPR